MPLFCLLLGRWCFRLSSTFRVAEQGPQSPLRLCGVPRVGLGPSCFCRPQPQGPGALGAVSGHTHAVYTVGGGLGPPGVMETAPST